MDAAGSQTPDIDESSREHHNLGGQPPPPEEPGERRARFPDEERDEEFEELENRLVQIKTEETEQHDIGSLAYLAGRPLTELIQEEQSFYAQCAEEITNLLRGKSDVLRRRIQDNTLKLTDLKETLTKTKTQEEKAATNRSDADDARGNAWRESTKQRMHFVASLAILQREERNVPTQTAAEPQPPPPAPVTGETPAPPVPLYLLDSTLTTVPLSQRDARIARRWTQIVHFRKDLSSTRTVTRGLSENGITYLVSKSLVWTGYSILVGAGGALGALLQHSDIGAHTLERFLGTIQAKLGFTAPSPGDLAAKAEPIRSLSESITGLASGGLLLLAFLVAVFAIVALSGWVTRTIWRKREQDEDDDTGTPKPQAAAFDHKTDQPLDSDPFRKSILRTLFSGEEAIAGAVPGFAVAILGLLFFLALAPNLLESGNALAISLTKTSIGFVFALAVAALMQLLFVFSIYPLILEKLSAGEKLALFQPASIARGLFGLIAVTTLTMTSMPIIWGLLPPAPAPPTASTVSSETAKTDSAMPSKAPRMNWPSGIVWFVTSTGLLLSCSVLAVGNTFLGVYKREEWIERHLRWTETKFIEQIQQKERPAPPPPIILNAAKPDPPTAQPQEEPLDTEIGQKWRFDLDSDVVLKRLLLGGHFKLDDLKPLIDACTEYTSAADKYERAKARQEELAAEVAGLESAIFSREKSSLNYENRILRLERQASALRLLLHERRKVRDRLLVEGYRIAQQAYDKTPDPPDPGVQKYFVART